MTTSTVYWWTEISDIPEEPGVYAWYYSIEITDFDLQSAIAEIETHRDNGDLSSAVESTEAFLQDFLFQYFQEEPYQATLQGLLKPKYEGQMSHKPELSDTLLQRISEEPERLRTIKAILERSAPNFASPIYIGMSKNLKDRLIRHKKLIEKYSSKMLSQTSSSIVNNRESRDRDQSFALRVCLRQIPPTRLFVTVNVLKSEEKRYVDIENILNRIHYPLLGRN